MARCEFIWHLPKYNIRVQDQTLYRYALLGQASSSVYDQPVRKSAVTLRLMRLIDEKYTATLVRMRHGVNWCPR